ncbi:MAG: thermonuclease family protein, partial [Myxococcota bacterium]
MLIDRVVDGDTAYTSDGESLRYLLIDAPEIAHRADESSDCYAVEASRANAALCEGHELRLEYDPECRDRYGRLLAYLWDEDLLINEVLVAQGNARFMVIPPNDRYATELLRAEAHAREAGIGLWGQC